VDGSTALHTISHQVQLKWCILKWVVLCGLAQDLFWFLLSVNLLAYRSDDDDDDDSDVVDNLTHCEGW